MDEFAADVAAIGRIDAVPTILEVVCRVTGMGFAAVARVTHDRWVACEVLDRIEFGLKPGGELDVATTICNEIRESGEPVVIDHVAEDDVYCGHPVPAMYGFQSYVSVPIRRRDGTFFGTLCAIDPKPARVKTPETMGMFSVFADLIAFHLDAEDRFAATEAALLTEREGAELREQFIAILGHDLRNPLASVDAGARLLRRKITTPDELKILTLMQNSVQRMTGLIENVMDFARGRLGGGLTLERDTATPLAPVLTLVIEELRAASPDRVIEADFAFVEPIDCDRTRIAQLLSNLLGNALAHGAPDHPVVVRAWSTETDFNISVSNAGEPIPADKVERLFQPFFRAPSRTLHEGLGLGLFIAAEIARGHGGTLSVKSDVDETVFTFSMPLR